MRAQWRTNDSVRKENALLKTQNAGLLAKMVQKDINDDIRNAKIKALETRLDSAIGYLNLNDFDYDPVKRVFSLKPQLDTFITYKKFTRPPLVMPSVAITSKPSSAYIDDLKIQIAKLENEIKRLNRIKKERVKRKSKK